jgi:hypothetical protein
VIFVAEQLAAQARREHERRQQRRREEMTGHVCAGVMRPGPALACPDCDARANRAEE